MASANFSFLTEHLALARINFDTDTFKAVLVSSIPDETALDTWDFLDDVNNEITDADYTAGGFSVTASVGTVDAGNNRIAVTYSAASPTYSTSTISAVGCIIYKDTTVASTSPLAHFVDFGETVSSTNGDFTVSFTTPFYINR
jgi:hypothetical protein